MTQEEIKNIQAEILEDLRFGCTETREEIELIALKHYQDLNVGKIPNGSKIIKVQQKIVKLAKQIDDLESEIWDLATPKED